MRMVPQDPVRIPITDVFDLHSVPPTDAELVVEAYLEAAHELGLKALRIIHGRGIGAQRAMGAHFGGDIESIRRAAGARILAVLGIPCSSGLALILSLVPDLERWSDEEKLAAARILQAKERGPESQYLRLMRRHTRLRAAFLALGGSP